MLKGRRRRRKCVETAENISAGVKLCESVSLKLLAAAKESACGRRQRRSGEETACCANLISLESGAARLATWRQHRAWQALAKARGWLLAKYLAAALALCRLSRLSWLRRHG